jgi:hypothetical protein
MPSTDENESGLLPTVRASDGERGGRGDLIQAVRGNENKHFKLWPTICAQKLSGTTREDFSMSLPEAVKLWPTPTASVGGPEPEGKTGRKLATIVKLLPTPTKQDASNNAGTAQMERNALPLNAVVGGSLNPTWVEWLMGYPLGWTDLKDSETPSSPKSPPCCSPKSLKSTTATKLKVES